VVVFVGKCMSRRGPYLPLFFFFFSFFLSFFLFFFSSPPPVFTNMGGIQLRGIDRYGARARGADSYLELEMHACGGEEGGREGGSSVLQLVSQVCT